MSYASQEPIEYDALEEMHQDSILISQTRSNDVEAPVFDQHPLTTKKRAPQIAHDVAAALTNRTEWLCQK